MGSAPYLRFPLNPFWRSSGHRPKQRLGTLSGDNQIGNRVGVLFVGIASFSNAALEMNARSLLDYMGCFMSGCVKVRAIAKGDIASRCVRFGANGIARCRRLTTNMSTNVVDVMGAKARLNLVGKGEHATRTLNPIGGDSLKTEATPDL